MRCIYNAVKNNLFTKFFAIEMLNSIILHDKCMRGKLKKNKKKINNKFYFLNCIVMIFLQLSSFI